MYKLLAILFEIEIFSLFIFINKESSKGSFSITLIFFPSAISFLSKNCKNSDELSFTPTQIPLSFLENVRAYYQQKR